MIRPILLLLLTALVQSFHIQDACSQKTTKNTSLKPSGTWAIEFSPDDKYYAFGGDDSLLQVYTAANHTLYKWYKTNGIKNISWHPDGQLLAIANPKGLQLLNMDTEQISTITGLKTGGRGIRWNHSGELLALADGSGIVQIMNKDGKLLRSIKKHNNHSYLAIDWHPSKNIIVTGSDEIILFDTAGNQLKLINHRKEHTGVLTVRWHPSGEFFASGDYGHEKEGKPTLLQFWKADGTLIKTITGHHSELRNIRWNKDGTFLATASDVLRIYNKKGGLVSTGKNTGYNVWGIGWNKKGNVIATSSFEGNIDIWTNKARLIKKIY